MENPSKLPGDLGSSSFPLDTAELRNSSSAKKNSATVVNGKTAAVATTPTAEPIEIEGLIPGRKFLLFAAVPAWAISMLLHVLVIMVLALVSFSNPEKVESILTMAGLGEEESAGDIEQFDLQEVAAPMAETSTEDVEPSSEVAAPVATMTKVDVSAAVEVGTISPTNFAVPSLTSASMSKSLVSSSSKSLTSRSTDMKQQLLKRYGGTDASESAVSRSLLWIKEHQAPNGGWTFEHDKICGRKCGDPGERTKAYNAATALAILPFLGAGQTHIQGQHKETVGKGLRFLVNNMQVEGKNGFVRGSLMEGEGNMYSHGLATIALCEAFAMTEDPTLAQAAQAAVNHIIYAQDPRGGGWRYSPQQAGDTSVVGWQLMALKSGYMGHLQIPPDTFRGAVRFLDFVSTSKGAYYGYDKATTGKPAATTAIGLLCRMYLGWDRTNPGIAEGVKFLSGIGVNKKDIYYDYYAAQVLRHHGGAEWAKFNTELRDWLVSTQVSKGHASGSWHFPDSLTHRGPIEGGRLASTSFATMILEVYYRHMPLYADSAAEDDFPL